MQYVHGGALPLPLTGAHHAHANGHAHHVGADRRADHVGADCRANDFEPDALANLETNGYEGEPSLSE